MIFKTKVRIICHAQWEISFEFFSLRNYLNLLSTISFSDSVDELYNELDVKDLTSFVSFCWSVLLYPGLMKGNFFSFSLTRVFYFALLVQEVSRFPDTPFAGSSYELSLALSYFCPASSLVLTTGKVTFTSC